MSEVEDLPDGVLADQDALDASSDWSHLTFTWAVTQLKTSTSGGHSRRSLKFTGARQEQIARDALEYSEAQPRCLLKVLVKLTS